MNSEKNDYKKSDLSGLFNPSSSVDGWVFALGFPDPEGLHLSPSLPVCILSGLCNAILPHILVIRPGQNF